MVLLNQSGLMATFGKSQGMPGYNGAYDLNYDKIVNVLDFSIFSSKAVNGTLEWPPRPPAPVLPAPVVPVNPVSPVPLANQPYYVIINGKYTRRSGAPPLPDGAFTKVVGSGFMATNGYIYTWEAPLAVRSNWFRNPYHGSQGQGVNISYTDPGYNIIYPGNPGYTYGPIRGNTPWYNGPRGSSIIYGPPVFHPGYNPYYVPVYGMTIGLNGPIYGPYYSPGGTYEAGWWYGDYYRAGDYPAGYYYPSWYY